MSNILIGLLSMALFIGLALSGAIYFSGSVLSSSNDSRALGYVTRIAGVAQAVAMRNREEGSLTQASTSLTFLTPSYMDEVRTLPNGTAITLVSSAGTTTGNAAFAAGSIGLSSTQNDRLCTTIAGFAAGRDVTISSFSAWPSTGAQGCFKASAAIGPYPVNSLIVFVRI